MKQIRRNDSISFEEFLVRLPIKIRKLYLFNFKAQNPNKYCNNSTKCFNNWIACSFSWDITEEGSLWQSLADNLSETLFKFEIKDFGLDYSISAKDYMCRTSRYDDMIAHFKKKGVDFNEEDCVLTWFIPEYIEEEYDMRKRNMTQMKIK